MGLKNYFFKVLDKTLFKIGILFDVTALLIYSYVLKNDEPLKQILPNGISFTLASACVFFVISGYQVWKDELNIREDLETELSSLKNKLPIFKVTFEDLNQTLNLSNLEVQKLKYFICPADDADIRLFNQYLAKNLDSITFGNEIGQIKEIENDLKNEYLPFKLCVKNIGSVPATNIKINVTFPVSFHLLENIQFPEPSYISYLPNNSYISSSRFLNSHNKVFYFQKKLQHHSSKVFQSIFITNSFDTAPQCIKVEIYTDENPEPLILQLKIKTEIISINKYFENDNEIIKYTKTRDEYINNPNTCGYQVFMEKTKTS